MRERPAPYRVDGPLYCDASALLKLYFPESGSDELNRLLEGREDLVASDLAVTEIVSALARRAREDALGWTEASRVHRAILSALDGGVLLGAIAAVANTSDEYDDRIVAKYGGQTALDRIRDTGGRRQRASRRDHEPSHPHPG